MAPVPQEFVVKREAETSTTPPGDRVIISGMSGLYPQCHSVKELSDVLYNKINPIESNSARWKFSHPEVAQYTGMVPDLDRFDAQFFRVHFRLGGSMDSMARKLLEQTYQAIYDAGVSPEQLSGRKVGVYIGTCFSETEKTCFYVAYSKMGLGIAGCNKAMFANRISYWLNAKGPSMSIDQACCSSLAALEQAYLAMKRGECEAAIVGGANLSLHPHSTVHYARIIKLCPDGKTKCFDQNADGCVKSEAINVLFLQKAKDALRIYAEVMYAKAEFTAVSQYENGQNFGFYREPKIISNFFKKFYEEAGVSPNAVEYVEAFGAAVADADKAELAAIDEAFCKDRRDPLLVGSVMSNIGYSEAATGISAITKVLLGYHTGQLAGNLHCENPRQDAQALQQGRLQIITDHARFGRSYTAVNGMSVTGVNGHVLLYGHYKPKNVNRYKSNIPHLVTISGRHDSAVKRIIEDLKGRPIDPEEIALLHNVNKTKINGHTGRGFVILATNDNQETVSLGQEIDYFGDVRRPLWFVYSGMGSQWAGMGAQLMRIPIFAAAIERCHRALSPKGINIVDIITSPDKSTFDNILNSFVGIAAIQIGLTDILHALGIVPDKIIGHSVGELGCAYADGCLTAEEMILSAYSRGLVSVQTPFIRGSMAAVGVGYQQISKMCPPEIEVACHNGPESSTISGPADVMMDFVRQLTEKGIFAKEVPCSNIAYHSQYISNAGPGLLKYLREVITSPKPRSERWVSTSVPQNRWNEPIAKLSSAEYHTNNLLSPVLFEETAALIPPNAVLVEIAPHGLLQAILKRSLPESCCNIALTRRGHHDNAYLVLEAIGKLYIEGFTPIVEVLYPKVEFPVSTGTPMLSHTVEWVHDEKWTLPLYSAAYERTSASCDLVLSVHDEEHSYLRGHVVRGKTLFPFAAALVAVWDTLAMSMNVPKKQLSVKYIDVHLYVQPVLHEQHQLRLSVSIHKGSGQFEVLDDYSKIITGKIVHNIKEILTHRENKEINNSVIVDLSSEDIYSLLDTKDYAYSGDFRSLYGANLSMTEAFILWRDNWVTFLDGVLQFNALRHTHEGVSVPKQIRTLYINVMEHSKHLLDVNGSTIVKAEVSDVHKYTRCGGIIVEHLELRDLPLVPEDNFAVKTLQFVPRFGHNLDYVSTLHVYLQIVAENINQNYVNVIGIVNNGEERISMELKRLLNVYQDLQINYKELTIEEILKTGGTALSDVDLILLRRLSEDDFVFQLLYRELNRNVFVVSEEDNISAKKSSSAVYRTLSTGGGLKLVRWRPLSMVPSYTSVTVYSASDIALLSATRATMQPHASLLVLASQPPPPGLKDLIRSWRNEPDHNQIRLVITNSKTTASPIDVDVDLAFNIWNDGQWGGEYYILSSDKLENGYKVVLQSKYITDISSLHWVQASEHADDSTKVIVHYAAINTTDVLKATGVIRFADEKESIDGGYGMDFSGVTESGYRVMGVARGACSSELRVAPELLWPVPGHWSLEDAATVPLPYLNAFYCYLNKFTSKINTETEQITVLVHGGAGALGQAAISIGLGLDCQVFTTVSDVTKKQFLLKLFPQLKAQNIGNSRDHTFGDMVLGATKGVGCDIVISTVKTELKNVSMKCCREFGTTYDFTQLSQQEEFSFGMSYLCKERSYLPVDLSAVIRNWNSKTFKILHDMMSDGIARGYVRPLSRVTYAPHDAPRAFRLLAASAHRGRALLRLHGADLHVEPRINCTSDEVHLILCDQSLLGLHLADRLISRGAKKLHLHCAGPYNYLHYKLRSWGKINVQAEISSDLIKEASSAIIDKAMRLGSVGGIYILATDHSVRNDEEFATFLSVLDLNSRKLCPSLRYFTVISSDFTGMFTCRDRVNNGYPATLLKLDLSQTSREPEGSLGLSAPQCQGLVSVVERAVHSAQPVLVAHQLRAHTPPLLQQIVAVAGVVIPDNAPENATLERFGVQHDTLHVIRNYLELFHNIALYEDVELTVGRLRQIENAIMEPKFEQLKGLSTLFPYVDSDELQATTDIVSLPTLISNSSMDEFQVSQTYLCIIPGLDGHHGRFSYMCERLKLPALVLQPGLDRPHESIQDTSKRYAQILLKRTAIKNNFQLLGYQWGMPVALEVASLLEQQGMVGTIFCVGVGPEELKQVLEEELSYYKSEEELQDGVLAHMCRLMAGDQCEGLKEVYRGCHTWDEKVEACVRTLLGRVSHSAQYARALLQAALGRIEQARRYSAALPPLRSRVVLLRSPRSPRAPHAPPLLQLRALTSGEVSVHELSAPLAHAARDTRCAAIINSHLEPQIIQEFHNKNLCNAYVLGGGRIIEASL